MTKLNHARPSLKLSDNWRRELMRHPAPDWRSDTTSSSFRKGDLYDAFDSLPSTQRLLFNAAVAEYAKLIERRGEFFSAMAARSRSQAKKSRALSSQREHLLQICTAILEVWALDGVRNEGGILGWYGAFVRSLSASDQEHWEELSTILLVEAVELAFPE